MSKHILAWHFTDGYKTRTGLPVVVGKTYMFNGEPILCQQGLHASVEPFDAIVHAPGSVLSLVECWGKMESAPRKFCCTRRKILVTRDIGMELRNLACQLVREMPVGPDNTLWNALPSEAQNFILANEEYIAGTKTLGEIQKLHEEVEAVLVKMPQSPKKYAALDVCRSLRDVNIYAAYGVIARQTNTRTRVNDYVRALFPEYEEHAARVR